MRLFGAKQLGAASFLLAVLLPFVFFAQSASAAIWDNRGWFMGYFTNTNPRLGGLCEPLYGDPCGAQGYVLPPNSVDQAIPDSIDTVPEFINLLKTDNSSGNTRLVNGSGFVVQSLLGRSGDQANARGGANISAADWNELQDRLYNPNLSINWHDNWSSSINIYMQAGTYDVAKDNVDGGQAGAAITFRNRATGQVYYALFRECANPDGNLTGGIPQGPRTTETCGTLKKSPGEPVVGQSETLTGTVTFTGGPTVPRVSGAAMTVNGTALNSGSVSESHTSPYTPPPTVPPPGEVDVKATITAGAAGTYTVKWSVAINELSTITCSGTLTTAPPTVATCGSLTVSSDPMPNQSIPVTGTITYTGGPDPASTSNPAMTVTGPGSTQVTGTALGGSSGTVTVASSVKVASPGVYTVHWSADLNELGTVSCSGTFEVLQHPYVQVNGGDTLAGAGFAAPDSSGSVVPCSAAPRDAIAGVASWSSNSGTYDGAGDEYAVYALNYIQEFASSRTHTPPTALSFSNVNDAGSVNAPGGMFGGMFGSVSSCVDYWGSKPPVSSMTNFSSANLNGLTTGNYYAHPSGSPLVIGNSLINDGVHATLYVDGDVHIVGQHIKYASSSWSDTQDIPSLRLVVHGSIFIDNSVDTLDGTYVAVPDSTYATATNLYSSPKPGTISTCAKNNASYDPTVPGADLASDCNNQLTVNGSFVANQIWLLRSYSSLGVAGSQPAETFNYGPAVWLAPGSADQIKPVYQSVRGLPPIL